MGRILLCRQFFRLLMYSWNVKMFHFPEDDLWHCKQNSLCMEYKIEFHVEISNCKLRLVKFEKLDKATSSSLNSYTKKCNSCYMKLYIEQLERTISVVYFLFAWWHVVLNHHTYQISLTDILNKLKQFLNEWWQEKKSKYFDYWTITDQYDKRLLVILVKMY